MNKPAFSDGSDEKCVRLELPLPPSVNAMYINVPGRGRSKSQDYKIWVDAAGWTLKEQRPGSIKGPYDLSIFVPEDMRGDVDNRIKPISDLLVSHGVIPDDSKARSVSICRTPQVIAGAQILVHEVSCETPPKGAT